MKRLTQSWKPIPQRASKSRCVGDKEYLGFRTSQPTAFKKLRGKRFAVINSPTGWGKTFVQIMLALDAMRRDPKLRVVIALPKRDIAKGFLEKSLLLEDSSLRAWAGKPEFDWFVQHNLCGNVSASKVDQLHRFLSTAADPAFPQGRVLVCTHQLLSQFHKKHPRFKYVDTMLFIDEAHHLMNAEIAESSEYLSNGCGEVAIEFLKQGAKRNLHLQLATATYGRADDRHIIPSKLMKKFTWFELPFDDYLKSMNWLTSFDYGTLFYRGGPEEAIANSLKERLGNAIIYLPHRKSKHATSDKYAEVARLVKSIAKLFGGRVNRGQHLIVITLKSGSKIKILDLVTEEGRDERVDWMKTIKSRDDLHIIIALGLCNEGFDWDWADQEFIIGDRGSAPNMLQMWGRLFRDRPGKKHVAIWQLLRDVPHTHGEKYRKLRSDYLNSLLAGLLLMDIFMPAPVGTLKTPDEAGHKQDLLRSHFTNLSLRIKFEEEATRLLATIESQFSDEQIVANPRVVFNAWLKASAELLKRYDFKGGYRKIATQLWLRRKMRFQKGSSAIPLDLLTQGRCLDGYRCYLAEQIGLDTFERIRIAMGHYMSDEECSSVTQHLARQNGGTLPCARWLMNNGYGGLAQRLKRYPHLLAGISWERGQLKEHEVHAQFMHVAEECGGQLPRPGEFNRRWPRLYFWFRKRPDLARGIPVQKPIRAEFLRHDECRQLVTQLAKENGGTLPPHKWLVDNGYRAVAGFMRKNRHLLGQIAWDNLKRVMTNKDVTAKVRELAKANSGKLPCQAWLVKNGHRTLVIKLYKNRKLLNGIEWEKRKPGREAMSEQEARSMAQSLAAKNGGRLPPHKWLQEHKLFRLLVALRRYPRALRGISRERLRRKNPK